MGGFRYMFFASFLYTDRLANGSAKQAGLYLAASLNDAWLVTYKKYENSVHRMF